MLGPCSDSKNGFVQYILFVVYCVFAPIFGLGGSFVVAEYGFYLLPFGLIGVLLAIKLVHLAGVASDRI